MCLRVKRGVSRSHMQGSQKQLGGRLFEEGLRVTETEYGRGAGGRKGTSKLKTPKGQNLGVFPERAQQSHAIQGLITST